MRMDSVKDKDSGAPVYDYAFFVDDRDENGIRLDKIEDYEAMLAHLVYMQLYAPMKSNMYSEEDNTFLPFAREEEPLYGSCGTAMAEYPLKSVKTYCAIRAAQDAIKTGWNKIDYEIEEKKEEIKRAEKEGIYSRIVIDPRNEYVKLFEEKTSVKPQEAGRDRFFISIAHDVKNETLVKKADGNAEKRQRNSTLGNLFYRFSHVLILSLLSLIVSLQSVYVWK